MEPQKNTMHDMMTETYGDSKTDKIYELNATMTINNASADEYTQTLRSIGGND